MFKEIVEVVDVRGSDIRIAFQRRKTCDSCKISHFCNSGKDTLLIRACGFILQRGDRIEIGVDEKRTVQASFLLFLLPAAIFVGCLIVFAKQQEHISFLLAFLGLCLYYGMLKLFMRKQAKKFEVTVLRKT